MKCKNCGARLNPDSNICPNCGASSDGYVLMNSDVEARDYRRQSKSSVKTGASRVIRSIIVFVLVLALVGGSYYYFQYKHINKDAPKLSFTSATGVINDDQKIVYLTIDDSSGIEYIHGVSLYEGDTTKLSIKKPEPVSTAYEYTKDVGEAVRAIFFYADDLGIKAGNQYTYTFEMVFGFAEDTNFYTYQKVIEFDGDINEDASDKVFDHSMKQELELPEVTKPSTTAPSTTEQSQSTTQQTDSDDLSFVFSGFWFTEPYRDADNMQISAWKFNTNATVDVTSYNYTSAGWEKIESTFVCEIKGPYIYVKDGDNGEVSTIKLNPADQSVVQRNDEDTKTEMIFTQRKYNSIKNVEDFFGM